MQHKHIAIAVSLFNSGYSAINAHMAYPMPGRWGQLGLAASF